MVQIINEIRVKQTRSWEEIVSAGMNAREDVDNGNWTLGDLALEVTKEYGEDSIGKYSYAIGVIKKTLMGYRTVSKVFNPEVRARYRKLSFSHFKTLASLPKPEAWLEKADDNDWSVEMMTEKIKDAYGAIKDVGPEDKPPKVYRCPECNHWRLEDTSSMEICRGHYNLINGKMEYK